MTEKPIIEIGSSFEIPPGSNLGNIQKDFEKLEKSQEKANNFMMWMTGIIAGVFFVTGILIAFDYFKYNQERYEKFIDKITEIQKDYYSKNDIERNFINKSDFYSKNDIKSLFVENTKNSQILECLKIKGRFSAQCF
ncbi:MAG: hypothetical protein AAB933_01225 [Patescibacteria group bacterium]